MLYTVPDSDDGSGGALLLTSNDELTTSNSIAGVYICNATNGNDFREEVLNITVQCEYSVNIKS